MDFGSEQEFLSGIEPLSNSETSTPHSSKLANCFPDPDSLNSTSDPSRFPLTKPGFSPSPVKSLSAYTSPIISKDSFNTAAQEITKRIQESLTSSLKLEKQAEACLSLSPSLKRKSADTPLGKSSSSRSATSLPVTPLKSTSPSKLKVRFEDEAILKMNDLNPVSTVSQHSFSTPIKTSREDRLFDSPPSSKVSPVKNTDLLFAEVDIRKPSDVSKNLSDSFLLSSLKLPQNDEEREKLFQFMKKMETSSAGDPLSSLFALENKLKQTESSSSLALNRESKTVENLQRSKSEKEKGVENGGRPQLRKTKLAHKKTSSIKENGKKFSSAKTEAREPYKKKGLTKKNPQKKPSKENKPSQSSKGSANSDTVSAPYSREGEQTIGGMEMIRNQLQGMLKMDGSLGCAPDVADDYKLCFGEAKETKNASDAPDSFRSSDTATLLSAKPTDFAPPPSSPDSSTGNVDALINSATSSIFNLLRGNNAQPSVPNRTSTDSSVTVENNILRDTLEKERYRRNHCEKQIQKLQNRILEIQQELAVGRSVSRKKDMMIEQLDKTLSKVVDGWKNHERKLVTSAESLTAEKDKLVIEARRLSKIVDEQREKLTKVSEELSSTKEKLQLKEEEQKLLQQTFQLKTHEISRVIDQKNASLEKLLNDKHAMVEDINKLTRKMEELQEAAERDKERLSRDFLEQQRKIEGQVQTEKTKLEQERSKNGDLQKMLSTTQQEVTRLEDLMTSLKQTIDSLKMQSALEETKYTTAIRKVEADHQIELEKKVTEKLSKVHEDAEKKEKELRDSHHKQVMEITSSHRAELESQCKMYEDRIEQLQQRAKSDMEHKEKQFEKMLKEKNENMRRQMVNKMQNLLQAHYNETLEVVGSTTGTTPMRPTRTGTLSCLLHDMQSSKYMTDSKLNDISNLDASTTNLQDTLKQTNSHSVKALTGGDKMASEYADVSSMRLRSAHLDGNHQSFFTNPTTSSLTMISGMARQDLYTTSGPAVAPTSSGNFAWDNPNLQTSSITQTNQSYIPQPNTKRTVGLTPSLPLPEESKLHTNAPNTFEAEINLATRDSLTPGKSVMPDENVSSPISTQEGDRKQYLQHYIKMLLDKSPGEPLDAPSPSAAPGYPIPPPSIGHLSPIIEPLRVPADENKENTTGENQPKPVTSEIALGVINFLNQQLKAQPSPDIIPKQNIRPVKSPQKPSKAPDRRVPQRSKSGGAFQPVRIQARNKPPQHVRNADKSSQRGSPNKQETHQLSIKDLETKRPSSKVNGKQVSDISHMLESYMSGDTQEAAEKLLSYLADSQKLVHEESFGNCSQISRSRNKPKTPSKSGPAWR